MSETPLDIYVEYVRQETLANRTPQGADHARIIRNVAEKLEMLESDVRDVVRRYTVMQG